MALRPWRECADYRCTVLTRNKYCPIHEAEHNNDRSKTQKEYDRKRGRRQARGYDSRYEKSRDIFLRNNPLCDDCLSRGIISPSEVYHHIDGNAHNRSPDNAKALCRDCHERIHGRKK